VPTVHWLWTDHLNSVRLVLDETGAVLDQIAYDAFGNIVALLHPPTGVVGSLFDNPILFTSREFDAETGLYYNRARYLDPTTGRWTTQDPLGFALDHLFPLERHAAFHASVHRVPRSLSLRACSRRNRSWSAVVRRTFPLRCSCTMRLRVGNMVGFSLAHSLEGSCGVAAKNSCNVCA
jgi:RHS repeat-associated protein